MRIGVYAPDPAPDVLSPLIEGYRAAGHQVAVSNGRLYRKRSGLPKMDLAFIWSARGPYGDLIEDLRDITMIPVFVLDLAPMLRSRGFYQVGESKLNGLCPEDPISDRLNLESLIAKRSKAVPPDGPIVAIGQKPDDAQHGLSSKELYDYFESCAAKIHGLSPSIELLWRPHPKDPDAPPPAGYRALPRAYDSIQQTIESTRARAALTYNSTGALEAIAMRYPVFCHASAFYAGLATDDLDGVMEPASLIPDVGKVKKLFAKISWLIWTPEEMGVEIFRAYIDERSEAIREEQLGPREQRQALAEQRINDQLLERAKARRNPRGMMRVSRAW